jgi:hypothetical protein
MGRKPKRQRQHILFFIAAGLILLMMAAGCRQMVERSSRPAKDRQPTALPATTGETPKAVSRPTDLTGTTGGTTPTPPSPGGISPLTRTESQLLDRAQYLLQKGDSAAALRAVDKAITCCNGRFADRALHILTDAMAQPDVAAGHRSQVIQCFDRLEAEHPEVVYGPAARCWTIALNALLRRDAEVQKLRKTNQQQRKQIQKLQKQIEQLKAVDLELETPKPNVNVP